MMKKNYLSPYAEIISSLRDDFCDGKGASDKDDTIYSSNSENIEDGSYD